MLNLKRAGDPNSGLDSLSSVAVSGSTISFNRNHEHLSTPIEENLGNSLTIEGDHTDSMPAISGGQDDVELANAPALQWGEARLTSS